MLKIPALTWIYAIDAPLALAGLWFFRSHWRMALYVIVLMTAFNLFSHGTPGPLPDLPAEGTRLRNRADRPARHRRQRRRDRGGLLFGGLSERFGRRRGIVVAALLSVLVIPLWAFSHGMAMLAAGAFLMQFMVQGAWGIIPAHLNELSPGHARGAFPGYAYQVGNLWRPATPSGRRRSPKPTTTTMAWRWRWSPRSAPGPSSPGPSSGPNGARWASRPSAPLGRDRDRPGRRRGSRTSPRRSPAPRRRWPGPGPPAARRPRRRRRWR